MKNPGGLHRPGLYAIRYDFNLLLQHSCQNIILEEDVAAI